MSKTTKAQLVATAVALGLGRDKAESYTKDQLKQWIETRGDDDREGVDRTPGGESGHPPPPIKAARPKPGKDMQPKHQNGHVVIIKKVPEGCEGDFSEGDAAYGYVDEDGNLHLMKSEGEHVATLAAGSWQWGEDVHNTGIEPGDIVRRQGSYYAIIGITQSGAFGAVLFQSDATLRADPDSLMATPNPTSFVGSPERFTWDELVTEDFYFWDNDQLELSQEGINYLAKLEAMGVVQLNREASLQVPKLYSCDPRASLGSDLIETYNNEPLKVSQNASVLLVDGSVPFCTSGTIGWFVLTDPDLDVAAEGLKAAAAHKGSFATGGERAGAALVALSLDLLESAIEEQEESRDSQPASESEEGLMEKSRKGLGDLKTQPKPDKRETAPSDRVKKAVEETMGDSDKLANSVMRAINKHRAEFREALGVDENIRELGENMLSDIESAFNDYERSLEDWKRAAEQKLTSKVEFTVPELPEFTVSDPHYRFEDLLLNATLREPTLMVGPSGSGKTTAMRMVADALGLPFGYMALGPTQTEVKVSGYPDAQGVFVPTEFYLRFKYGGVFGFDEIDAANPSALVWINGAIQNRIAAFPRGLMSQLEREGYADEADELREAGGQVHMHPDCVILASANTFGKGADLIYQGRNALDGATLKRFLVLEWNYDEALERKLAGDDLWVDFVQAVRRSVQDQRMEHIVSPVDSIRGAKLLAAGVHWQKVAFQTVFAGLQNDDIKKIARNKDVQIGGNPVANVLSGLREKLEERHAGGDGHASS